MAARLYYQAFEFTAGGARAWLSIQRQYLSESDGPAQKAEVNYTVKTWFLEPSFAENQARYRALRAALAGASEGVLRYLDEEGVEILKVRARLASEELPEQWGEHMAEVVVTFRATEVLSSVAASTVDILFTPSTPGAVAITLPGVLRFSEGLRGNRYSANLPNRRETAGAIDASGKVRADPALAIGARRTWLLAQKTIIQGAMDCKEGTLVFADFLKVVRVEGFDIEMDDGSEELTWTLSASYLRFPAGDYAEADFVVTQRDALESSERLTSVRGKVRADDEPGALAKAAAIQAIYAPGRQLLGSETGTPRVSGTDGDSFVDLDFSLDFRELLSVTSWRLSVSTRDESESGTRITSYSGTVTALNAATAVAKARDLGDDQHPVRKSATETIETSGIGAGGELLAQVTFAYEYTTATDILYAEAASDVSREVFGASTQTVSGFAIGPTQAAAETLARSLKPTGLMLRSDRESVETEHKDGAAVFVKVTFSYTYHRDALAGSISYSVKVSEDLGSRETMTGYSGVAYGANEAQADALISTLIGSGPGGSARRTTNERESRWDKSGSDTKFIERSFSVAYTGTMAAGSDDILEAQYSVENIWSIQKAILTEIPFGTPHVQTACGLTVGVQRVSGSIMALNLATAKTWARAKKPAGGYLLGGDNRERTTVRMQKFSGTEVQAYVLDFDYAMAYPNLAEV